MSTLSATASIRNSLADPGRFIGRPSSRCVECRGEEFFAIAGMARPECVKCRAGEFMSAEIAAETFGVALQRMIAGPDRTWVTWEAGSDSRANLEAAAAESDYGKCPPEYAWVFNHDFERTGAVVFATEKMIKAGLDQHAREIR